MKIIVYSFGKYKIWVIIYSTIIIKIHCLFDMDAFNRIKFTKKGLSNVVDCIEKGCRN